MEWFDVAVELRCKCGRRACDAPKTVAAELLTRLNMARMLYGKPMVVSSGLRCRFWNAKVGGAPDSEHLTGEGADIRCPNSRSRLLLLDAAREAGFKRIGIAGAFLHLGVSKVLDQDVLWLYPPRAA